MKKVVALVLALIIVLSCLMLTACGKKKSEVQKIVWFSFKDTMKATGVVLVTILVFAVVIGLLDFGFTEIIKLLANITK